MTAYYNEKDPFAAAWLRNLIAANMIAPGDVDERSIEDVIPLELTGYKQCHFFAGIGVWSHAMRTAGWPDDRRAWSGSCPCQPFSQAGQGAGFTDERHLWPAFFHLIEQCRPPVVFGEQVASPDGLAWLDLVQLDMEGTDYAFGALDQCAAGFGAPHIRQRLYWVADNNNERQQRDGRTEQRGGSEFVRSSPTGGLADVYGAGPQGRSERRDGADERAAWPYGMAGGLADTQCRGREGGAVTSPRAQTSVVTTYGLVGGGSRPTDGFWGFTDWLRCKDERWRPVEPGTFPLAHGVTNRVGLLRGYGNAIVAPQAVEFVRAAMNFAP